MKIRRLSIQGFKSFVDRVDFHFPTGTSAIVGPNGCGKSNVVDAIRWVLGEHNARHLRGKLMEDLIFNGSDTRKSHGMAEVTMTLANDGGNAPARYAAFPEIEVRRRLYRSGESEYYINKVQSRLKDIVELFTDTGIGTNSYSIIEQGQVSWLVNAKPLERRVLIEEAAGINKFKQKKDASVRRLDSTKENLTRVSDIISEVKRQLNSLKRQANKAERFKKFKDELKGLELGLASIEHNGLAAELVEMEKGVKTLSDEETAAEARIEGLEAALDSLKVDYLSAENSYNEVRTRSESVEREIQAEEHAGELMRARCAELKRNEERVIAEIRELTERQKRLLSEKEGFQTDLSAIEERLTSVKEGLTVTEEKFRVLAGEINEKTGALRTAEARLLDGSSRITSIKHSLELLIKEEERLIERRAAGETEERELDIKLTSLGDPIESLRASLKASAESREVLTTDLSNATSRLSKIDEEGRAVAGGLEKKREERARKGSSLTALEEMAQRIEGLDEGVRAIMDSAKSGETKGIHGLVADVIEPLKGYERAVEAALGTSLAHVIVESQADGVHAVERLVSDGSGRGSFLPLKELGLAISAKSNNEKPSDALEPLTKMVKVKEGYVPIVDYLLADVVLAKTLEEARTSWHADGGLSYVTRDGDLIDSFGAITGGFSSGASDGILQHRSRMATLNTELLELEEDITGDIERFAALNGEARQLRHSIESIKEKLHAEDLGKVSIASDLKLHEEDLLRLTRRREQLTGDLSSIKEKLTRTAAKKEALKSERDGLEKKFSDNESLVTEHKASVEALGGDKEAITAELTEIKVEYASIRERQGAITGQLREKFSAHEETGRRIEQRRSEVERGRSEDQGALGKIAASEEALAALLVKKDETGRLLVEKGEAIEVLNKDMASREITIKEEKKVLASIIERKTDQTIELKEGELTLASIRDRIIDRYGIEIEGYVAPEPVEQGSQGEEVQAFAEEELPAIKERAMWLREKIASLGEVSLAALAEYTELEVRYNFLIEQRDDLDKSVDSLMNAIGRINRTTKERFKKTFDAVNIKFKETFPKFFNGGRAELRLTDEENLLESGIDIVAQPPGKKLQNIMLLSGGEKALTATAFIFSLFLIKPAPFCLLDEVDAPLDDANVERFNGFVHEMSKKSQFILITHNKRTMEVADTLYGITMEEPGVSKAVSVTF